MELWESPVFGTFALWSRRVSAGQRADCSDGTNKSWRGARVGIVTVHQLETGVSQPLSFGAPSKRRESSSSTETAAAPGCGCASGNRRMDKGVTKD
jgi:hypothetical protein